MDDILICIFHYEERTIDLNIHCWKTLGFKNIKVFSSKSKFHEKLIEMANFMSDKLDKYKLIIKSDADELVFSGIFNLIEKSISTKSDLCHGYFFDKFMNIWRGSGPKIYKPSVFRKILDKKLVITADVDCFDLCDILRIKLTGYVDKLNLHIMNDGSGNFIGCMCR